MELKITTQVSTQKKEEVPLDVEFSKGLTLTFSLEGKLLYAMDFENFKEFASEINQIIGYIEYKNKINIKKK
jgi:hypothetical protein